MEKIAPWLELGFEVHCLQKEVKYADRVWATPRGVIFHDHELIDMTDTAGLIANIDLVISVDTAPAHLAGACGRPTWVLLPFAPDFRWLTDRDDSPWYPTARLFRQDAPGDWAGVISAVADQLRAIG